MNKTRQIVLVIAIALAVSMSMNAIANALVTPGTIKISGSSTVEPVSNQADAEFENWMFTNQSTTIAVTVGGGGSGQGFTDLINNLTDIGSSSRPPSTSEWNNPALVNMRIWAVGIDSIAIIVHNATGAFPGSQVTQLSRKNVSDIFCGLITDWNQINPAIPVGTTIKVAVRIPTSGTADCFFTYFLKPYGRTLANITASANVLSENIDIYNLLTSPAGQWYIAYIGMGFLHLGNILPLAIDLADNGLTYVQATKANVLSGVYTPFRWLWYLTKDSIPEKVVEQWIAFVKNNGTEVLPTDIVGSHDYITDQGYINMWRGDFTSAGPKPDPAGHHPALPDNKVDYNDVIFFADAYIAYTKASTVHPYADFDANYVIDYFDILGFLTSYANYWNYAASPI